MKRLLLFVFFIAFSSNAFSQDMIISDRLKSKMESLNPLENVRVLIVLKDQVDIVSLDKQLYREKASLRHRAETVITTLRNKAQQTQGPILNYLNGERKFGKVVQLIPYWITNAIFVEATPEVINRLAVRKDIQMMDLDQLIDFDRPTAEFPAGEKDNTRSVEIGVKVIKADSLWARGFTGAGRVAMNIDGGVDGTHPGLGSRWMGNNGAQWYHAWFDPISPVSSSPFDCGSHGTHTMGIMCGREGGDTVGVAPDANWIAAGVTDCPGASYPSMNILAYQWAMDPDSNVATMDMPDVINCSWRDPFVSNECTSIYVATLNAVEAVGTAVVFSAGNSGPGTSTITPPKNINTDSVSTFCVGNLNGNAPFPYPISGSSSRGPSTCGGSGTLLIKPEVSAPGSSIRSTIPGGYGTKSGTSMASPHVAGAILLLRQAAPNLTGKEIKAILLSTCTDLGAAGEDNVYGKGLINVNAAYLQLGPNIHHIRLPNTENLSGPYTVNAEITSPIAPLVSSEIKLFWGRGAITDSVVMTNSSGNTWTASIPGNGSPAEYRYYMRAEDNTGKVGIAPPDAPGGYFSFMAAVDITPPSITHTPIQSVPIINWPATVSASVLDNIGVDSAWVRWYKNIPATAKQFSLTDNGSNNYSAVFNSTNSEVSIGDSIFYRVYANDNSAAGNKDSTDLYKIIFLNKLSEEFPANTFNTSNWATYNNSIGIIDASGVATGTFNHPIPSAPYFVSIKGATALLESVVMDLSSVTSSNLIIFESEHDLEAGESVYLEYFDNTSTWKTLQHFQGTNNGYGSFMPFDSLAYSIPSDGLHTGFKIRFRGDGLEITDEWYFDNICLVIDGITTNITGNFSGQPDKYNLNQNYPNPFNPSTRITFSVPVKSLTKLRVYDVLGRMVSEIVNDVKEPGNYIVDFNGSMLSSGIYYYRLEAGDFVQTRKMLLIK